MTTDGDGGTPRSSDSTDQAVLSDGFASLHERFELPSGFPAAVDAAADTAAARVFTAGVDGYVDRTDIDFVTLDPASSTDLDQAFAYADPDPGSDADVVLHYAIADVGAFVQPGDAIDREAWHRGVTVYLPDERVSLHPQQIAEGAGSMLPDVVRPAVVFTIRVASDGAISVDTIERSLVRSRSKLAYATVTESDLPPAFAELGRRIEAAELERGADRVDFPEQEIVRDASGSFQLRFRPRNIAERRNASMSLATNIAIGELLYNAGTGLFRTMPEVDERRMGRLRHTSRAFGLDWPKGQSLGDFERTLDPADPRGAAFLLAVRRAGGGASYEPFTEGVRPWHAAIKATYAHVTAPLRRLADRYVIEAALKVYAGEAVPAEMTEAFAALPDAMRRGDGVARRADRAALDMAEAVLLRNRIGEVFDAVVTDEDNRGARIQICEPAVVARVTARKVDPGDDIRVRLDGVDLDKGRIELSRVG